MTDVLLDQEELVREAEPPQPETVWDGKVHSYRPAPGLESRISASVSLHSDAADDLDPVTFEVIRNRLWTINIAHGEMLTRISGSPVFQSLDFNMCIMTETGEIAMNAPFLQYLASGAPMAIRYIMEHFGDDPGIFEGDGFVANDPWVGAAHQMDVLIATPVFVDGKLFAWISSAGHQYDLGGIVPGGWPQNAVDVYSDPVLFSPFKMIEKGELRPDLERMYLRQSRVPGLLALDLRAQIAGCRFAVEQIQEICEQFGPRTVKAAMRRILDNAQRGFAAKLSAIPDGTWSEVRYFDEKLPGDRATYRMQVNVTKTGDRLRIDNEGTDAQVDGPNNFVFTGFAGSVMGVAAVTMLYEQMFSLGGAERQIDFEPTPGLLTCADYPAPVSGGVMNILCHMDALMNVFSRMLATVPEFKRDLMVAGPEWPLLVFEGTDDRGNYFGQALMDPVAMGTGARSYKDGVDTSGPAWSPLIKLLNVEGSEQWYPVLYLYRRELVDGGGVGRWRGGTGMAFCVTPYRAHAISAVTNTGGQSVSTHGGTGIFGGYPSPTSRFLIARSTDLEQQFANRIVPEHIDSLKTEERILLRGKSNGTPLDAGDVLETTFTGGGGYGDPLLRESERVAQDVFLGYVSPETAETLYAVALNSDGTVDASRTGALHDAQLAERAAWKPSAEITGVQAPPITAPATGEEERSVHEYVVVRDSDGHRVLACSGCGHVVGDYRSNYKTGLLADVQPVSLIPHVIDPSYFLDEDMVLRRYCCPSCQVLMCVEVVRRTEPPISEFALV
jgi:N-methylhydantoinase B